eukprot:3466749-Rhodomonas_salina.2
MLILGGSAVVHALTGPSAERTQRKSTVSKNQINIENQTNSSAGSVNFAQELSAHCLCFCRCPPRAPRAHPMSQDAETLEIPNRDTTAPRREHGGRVLFSTARGLHVHCGAPTLLCPCYGTSGTDPALWYSLGALRPREVGYALVLSEAMLIPGELSTGSQAEPSRG